MVTSKRSKNDPFVYLAEVLLGHLHSRAPPATLQPRDETLWPWHDLAL